MTCTRSTQQQRLERLVRRAGTGDDVALAQLMAHLRPLLTVYLRDRVPASRDVDRLVEEVCTEVAETLRTSRERRTPFPAEAYAIAARRVRPGAEAPPDARLTPREQEILVQLGEGRSNAEIGCALYLSERTIAVHVARLLSKVGARHRDELLSAPLIDTAGDGKPPEDEGTLDLAAAHAQLRADVHATLTPPPPPRRSTGDGAAVVAFVRPGCGPG